MVRSISSQKIVKDVRRLRNHLILLCVAWTAIIACSLITTHNHIRQQIKTLALREADAVFYKDMIFLKGARNFGALYTDHITTSTEDNATSRQLHLLAPESILREANGSAAQMPNAIISRLIAFNPINAQNKPRDAWETQALKALRDRTPWTSAVESIDNKPYLRTVYPIRLEQSCIPCHKTKDNREGEIFSGISIATPLWPHRETVQSQFRLQVIAHAAFWILGMLTLIGGSLQLAGEIRKRTDARRRLGVVNAWIKAILDTDCSVAIIAADADGAIVAFSRGAEQLFGYRAQELIEKTSLTTLFRKDELLTRAAELARVSSTAPDFAIEPLEALVKTAIEHGSEQREWRVVCKDGSERRVHFSITAMRNTDAAERYTNIGIREAEEEPIGFLCVGSDITERTQQEMRLRENEEKYRVLFEASDDALFLVENGVILDINPRAALLFKTTDAMLIGTSVTHLFVKASSLDTFSLESPRGPGLPHHFKYIFELEDDSAFESTVWIKPIVVQGRQLDWILIRPIRETRSVAKQALESVTKKRTLSQKLTRKR